MKKFCGVFVYLVFLFILAQPQEISQLESTTIELEPFTSIHDCLPFNVKIEPSPEDTYELTIEAEDSLLEALSASVNSGVLSLGLAEGFNTSRVIKVTVLLPADALESVMSSSTSVLVVAPGFEVPSLTVSASGVATIRVFDISTTDLIVEGSASSIVFAGGEISSARIDVSGTSRAYCYGIQEEAEVHADGIGRVFLRVEDDDVAITGRLSALGRIYTTGGDCSVRGTFISGGCQQVRSNALPEFAAEYSCGLIVDGSIDCKRGRRGAASYTSTAVDGVTAATFTSGSGRVSTSTSGSGTATATATASSSSTGGSFMSSSVSSSLDDRRFESIVKSRGDSEDDDLVAVAATLCLDDDLDMFSV